jgi:hypothetical protein
VPAAVRTVCVRVRECVCVSCCDVCVISPRSFAGVVRELVMTSQHRNANAHTDNTNADTNNTNVDDADEHEKADGDVDDDVSRVDVSASIVL